ncbi:MAG TPA: PilT/PilU family type 4a pilus ATPase [Solirubrobacteraceae bacterium]|nr:PilT/PilU family type 4a pilus ATPase [Solirubrobacteraceae bacterium]
MSMFDIDAALRYLIQAEGSDLHLKVPVPPTARVHGHLSALEGEESLKPADTERVLRYMLTDPTKLDEFDREGEVDFAYSIEGLARFRVNAFRQRGSISLVCRAIPYSVRSIDQLNLPPVIRALAEEERGIILLTGTTGSGKSTTLAAMIDHMNQTMAKHVVTIEDPIEYLHRDKKSVINQREVGLDTTSFKRALRRVLRQDPDVILIGEMRDEETVQTALSAAETGHLVLSTVHTVDASESINRMLDFFPPHQHQQARAMIAGTLKGVVSQRLIPSADGGGRVAVCEILVMTGRVRDMIMDPVQTGRLHEVIQEGEYYGMQTFDQALLGHLQAGRITMDEALKAATHPHDFKLLVAAEGRRSTSMADVAPRQDAADDESAPAQSNGHGNGQPPAPVIPLAPVAPDGEPEDPAASPPAPTGGDAPGAPGSVAPPGAA